jgi:flavin-binding protein dodecin
MRHFPECVTMAFSAPTCRSDSFAGDNLVWELVWHDGCTSLGFTRSTVPVSGIDDSPTLLFISQGQAMELAKVIHIVSTSNKSFDDAIQQGVANASKTIRGISGIKVTDWTARVENDKLTSYKVTMDVAFGVENT